MVSFPNGSADGAPSSTGVTSSPLTICELLFLVGELMLRTGRDFPLLTGMNEARLAMVSNITAGYRESTTASDPTVGQLHDILSRAAAADGSDIAAMTGALAAMSVGSGNRSATSVDNSSRNATVGSSAPAPAVPAVGSGNAAIIAGAVPQSIGDPAANVCSCAGRVATTPAAPLASVSADANPTPQVPVAHVATGTANAPVSFASEALGAGHSSSSGTAAAGNNPPVPDNTRWYAITAGLNVGVYANWNTVAPLVVGVRGACFARYPSRGEARQAFLDALARGSVRIVNQPGLMYPDFDPANIDGHDSDYEDDSDEDQATGGGVGGAAVIVQ